MRASSMEKSWHRAILAKKGKCANLCMSGAQTKNRLARSALKQPPFEQGQVDWGYFGFITHHEHTYRLYAFVMTLGCSRASYLHFTICADTTWFIRCHLHAFAYLGGVRQQTALRSPQKCRAVA